MNSKGLITIAIGKTYAIQAKYLALSAILHAPHIRRAVITDCPKIVSEYYDIIIPYNAGYGDPFMTKTRLNLYTPFEQTVYLDADSLIMSNIDSYWESLNERSFAYKGVIHTSGEWYIDINQLMTTANVSWIPGFNSGMFVFDNSEKTNSIFNTAFDYMRNNKVLNVPFFRAEMLPDEPFFAIALAIYNEKPFEDHERFSRALMNADDIHIDVIKGIAHFHSITHGNYVHPLVVHFCGRFGRFLFWREKIKLFFYFQIPHVKTTILQIMFKRKEDDTIYY